MIILGIDPGSRITGYGFLRSEGNHLKCLEYGSIRPDDGEVTFSPRRLESIHRQLHLVLKRYSPAVMAVEDIFYAVNVKSALKLGYTRGVVLLAAAQLDIPCVEYSPLEVKKAVVGYGRADKRQIQKMVRTLLNLKEEPKPYDAADALAVAICHAFRRRPGQGAAQLSNSHR